MRKWTRTTLLFLAAASVYSFQGLSVAAENKANEAGAAKPEVKLVEDVAAVPAGATTKPAAKPAAQLNVSDTGTIDLKAVDADVHQILDMLSLQSHRNIIASKEVRGNLTAMLEGVTFKEALDAVLKANGYGYREKGNVIYVYSDKELKELEKSERQAASEVFRLHYTSAAVAANMIKPALSAEGQVAMTPAAAKGVQGELNDIGGDSQASDDIIVVRDYPENIERIRKILKEVDCRPQQILIEATILSAKLTDDNALGIDFTLMGGISLNDLKGVPQETRVAVTKGAIKDATTEAGTTGYSAGGTNFPFQSDKGLKIGVVYNNLALFINALEDATDTTVLANPKVLALNKQKGQVLVGRRDGYITTTVTQTSSTQTVEYLETGTKLMFRPFIAEDGYIRMEVHPEDSTGGVDSKGLPSKSTTEVTTNILVKDGNTVLIGGLFRESSSTGRSQVPGLGSIPVVGALFRQQNDSTVREEIIILLTPHIIKDDNAYAAASEQQLKDIDKIRVGVRRGMMFFGRERLAECCYDSAVREMAKPNPDRKAALWQLDCATNLNPMFLEAIKMKEGLTGREVTAVDNSSVRNFLRKQIIAERANAEKKTSLVVPAQPNPVAALTPTTQPALAQADAPTTQPAQASATTQPAQSELAATQDEQAAGDAEDVKSVTETVDETAVAAKPSEEAKPTTQPASGEENAKGTIVVVPSDEVAPLEDGEGQE